MQKKLISSIDHKDVKHMHNFQSKKDAQENT